VPDWTAPFRLPKYTSEEFRKLKADYVAKHGYTVSYPGLFDIIKVGLEKPLTQQEEKDWKAKRFDQFSELRLLEVRVMKYRRKERFLRMLASPTPEIVSNVGSFMCFLDNVQDALYTIGGAGILAMRFSPPPVAAALAIPTGVVLTSAGALNVIMALGRKGIPGIEAKRQWQKKTGIDPWSKKGRIKYAKRLIKSFSVSAGVIQGLQTSQEIFGVGISLGPIVGAVTDEISAVVRTLMGQKVKQKFPWPTADEAKLSATYLLKGMSAYLFPGLMTEDEEVISMMMANWLSAMTLYSRTVDEPGWDNYEDPADIEMPALAPTNPLTLEVIQEEGLKLDDIVGWPHNSKPWAPISDLVDEYAKPAKDYFDDYMRLHNHDWIGFIFSTLACDSTFYMMAATEGEEQVEYDYTATSKACSILLENRLCPDPEQPSGQKDIFADHLDTLEALGVEPTLRDLVEFCENKNVSLDAF